MIDFGLFQVRQQAVLNFGRWRTVFYYPFKYELKSYILKLIHITNIMSLYIPILRMSIRIMKKTTFYEPRCVYEQ